MIFGPPVGEFGLPKLQGVLLLLVDHLVVVMSQVWATLLDVIRIALVVVHLVMGCLVIGRLLDLLVWIALVTSSDVRCR